MTDLTIKGVTRQVVVSSGDSQAIVRAVTRQVVVLPSGGLQAAVVRAVTRQVVVLPGVASTGRKRRSVMIATILLYLMQLTGPDGQIIWLNPQQVISVREPRSRNHFAPGTKCLLLTTDGKMVTVQESCSQVRSKLNHRLDD